MVAKTVTPGYVFALFILWFAIGAMVMIGADTILRELIVPLYTDVTGSVSGLVS